MMLSNALLQRLLPTRTFLWICFPFYFLIQVIFRSYLPLLDFWWHLKMGQIIFDAGVIPRLDSFSFTASGKLYILQNWLGEVLLYVIYKAGGYPLLLFLNAVLLILTLAIIYRMCRRESRSLWASIVAATIMAICIPSNLRPQVFSLPLFAAFYGLLASYCAKGCKKIVWLPILMVLWVNLHAAFILGLGLIALFLMAECLQYFAGNVPQKGLSLNKIRSLGFILLACMIATLANPEYYSIYGYIRTVVQDASSRIFVSEWQPPEITDMAGILLFYFPFFLTTLTLIASERRPRIIDLMLYVGFAVFGMMALRNCIWFLLISMPIVARYLPSFSLFGIAASRQNTGTDKEPSPTSANGHKFLLLNLAIALMMMITAVAASPWMRQLQNRDSLLDPQTPIGAVEYIRRNNLQGNIFHPQIYGDYMLWKLWPQQRVFFDGRVHLYGEELVRNYRQVYQDSNWENILEGYKIRYLLTNKEKIEDKKSFQARIRQSSNWKVIFEDKQSILWEKSKHPFADALKK